MKNISNIKYVVLLGAVLSIGLSSCQVTNKYKSPEIDASGIFREDYNPEDTTTIANIPWREYFNDPYLQALIDEALDNNFDLLIVAERIKQAESYLKQARAAYFPSLALTGNVSHNRASIDPLTGIDRGTLGHKSTSYTLGAAVSWELDIWGRLNRQQRATYAQLLNSYAGRNLIQTQLISNIANLYYTLIALDEQLRTTNEMAALLQESLETMEALKDAGMQTGAAVEQTKGSLYSALATIPDLESNIIQLENSICQILGRNPSVIARGTLDNQIVPQRLEYGVPYQMLAKRPDVQQAELSFRYAFELTNVARASFYPSVNISSASLGYSTTNTLSNFFKPENLVASIVGGITQPIFARRQLITQLEVAKAEENAALLTFEQTVLNAGIEVSNVLATFEYSLQKNQIRELQVESLENAVYFTQELLLAGEANYLEVISAQTSLLQAQLSQINDKLEQLQATSDLYRALGGGVE